MVASIETIWSGQFGSADVEPPIPDALANGGTQPLLQSVYVAALHEGYSEDVAESAQFEMAAALAGQTPEVGRHLIEEKFRMLGGYSLRWLS